MNVKTVKKGDYGVVEIIKGQFKGRVGYYDDDESGKGIVYFGVPLKDPYYIISLTSIIKSDATHLPLEQWIRKFPEVAKQVGIHS